MEDKSGWNLQGKARGVSSYLPFPWFDHFEDKVIDLAECCQVEFKSIDKTRYERDSTWDVCGKLFC
jgi:hypothetical protein